MSEFIFDPRGWRESFKDEKNNLLYYLKDYQVSITHIGATAYTGSRSNRNVDILVAVKSIVDLNSVLVRLQSKKYKVIEQSAKADFYVLVAPSKVMGCGVTIRLMDYASFVFNRYQAFITLLKEDRSKIYAYNDFRSELVNKCGSNWAMYNELKQNYIEALIDENFKFE